jgi:hypothetical protein
MKERFKFNFQTNKKTIICDLKAKTQELWTKTRNGKIDMKTYLYYANIYKHEHEENMTRLLCKIVLEANVE